MKRHLLPAFACLAVASGSSAYSPSDTDDHAGRSRVVVLSDIGNEPDDQMSLVRFLVYSNEYDVEGLIATTSVWQKNAVRPDIMRELVSAYAKVRPNLLLHAQGWPTSERLNALIASGQPAYGMAAVGDGMRSPGAEALIRAADRDDARPLWVSVWGGANTLAQALWTVRSTRTPEQLAKFVSKLRVYSIADQDDAGAWIRREFPDLLYIVSPAAQNGEEYSSATWTGIAGDEYYRNGDGADFTTVSNPWLDRHIRSKGPLGRHYPRYEYIMEGDTPAFLGLIRNGLASHRNPSFGGWGGRYIYRTPRAETRPIWTQGGDAGNRQTSQDLVLGSDGRPRVSDQATIWRWRTAFQNDFAARMDWTVKPFAQANHNPLASLNGVGGTEPVTLAAFVGKPVRECERARSRRARSHLPLVPLSGGGSGDWAVPCGCFDRQCRQKRTPTATCRPAWNQPRPKCTGSGVAHIILEVVDSGTPRLTSYRRIILNISNATSE